MNRTGIEWTDFTWNPVTGCWGPAGTAEKPNRCSYCYAAKIAHRMAHIEGSGYGNGIERPNPTGAFGPIFHPNRLFEPSKVKKPSRIFVCSMADLFGDWVPAYWIASVLGEIENATSWHTYQFLTKNPKRLKDFNPWPSNCWVGTTITNQADMDERAPLLYQVDAPVRFVSHEPLLGAIDARYHLAEPTGNFRIYRGRRQMEMKVHGLLSWAIIGTMTGPGAVKPEPEWVRNLWKQYRQAETPVFMKNNLKPIMGTLVQEFPQ